MVAAGACCGRLPVQADISADWRLPRGLLRLLRGTYDPQQPLASPTREAARLFAWKLHSRGGGGPCAGEGGAGEREGVINKTCYDAVPGRVPECPGHQGCPGLLWGYFGVKTNEKKNDFTILRI